MTTDPNIVRVDGLDLLIVSLLVLVIGEFIRARVAALEKYSIPSAIIGGLICSIVVAALDAFNLIQVEFGTAQRNILLLVFFSTIGLTIKFKYLFKDLRSILVLLALASALLIFQNMVGSAIASAFGYHPAEGLIAGSISFMGGHGTGIAWSGIFKERFGLEHPQDSALAFATLGILAGGLFGGPLAELLIRRHGIQGSAESPPETPSTDENQSFWEGLRPSMLYTGIMVAICVYTAPLASSALAGVGVTLPSFVFALLLGAVLTNLADVCRIQLNTAANNIISDISLQFFLVMSVMSIHLWAIQEAAVPLLVVYVLQIMLVIFFVYFTVFPVMGRNYDSVVICAGFTGFGLGATIIGVGNMRAVTRKYGPSVAAFIVVPVVGGFLIDIVNSFIIQVYLLSPVLE